MQCFTDTGIDTHMLLTSPKPQCSLMSFLRDGKNEARKLNNERSSEFLPVIVLRFGMFLFLLLYPSSYKRHLCCVSHLDALAFARPGAGRPQGRAEEMLR